MKHLAKSILERFGYDLRRRREFLNPWTVQRHLIGRDDPLIFDVGAHEGESISQYSSKFPEARFHCFEPTSECAGRLRTRYASVDRVKIHEVALSNTVGYAEFHQHREDSTDMNSLLASDETGTQYYLPMKDTGGNVMTVPTMTVDAFCDKEMIDGIDILKVDVQGGELLVLEGAKGMLKSQRVRVCFLEVNFCRLYKGQAEFHEIAEFLFDSGMRLFGMYEIQYGRDGSFGWCNALFVPIGMKVKDFS